MPKRTDPKSGAPATIADAPAPVGSKKQYGRFLPDKRAPKTPPTPSAA